MYQDNESVILLEEDGIKSVGKASRHIKIKYFFVTNQIKGNELRAFHCPTEVMVADFYTKPLQGILFTEHCNTILWINNDNIALYAHEYTKYIEGIDTP